MLTGKELGAALAEAIRLKGVDKLAVARHFNVRGPSVHGWMKTGRIAKKHLTKLVSYFSDVVGPAHWGMPDFVVSGDDFDLVTSYSQEVGLGGSREAGEHAIVSHLPLRREDLVRRRLKASNLRSFRNSAGDSMEPYILNNDEVVFDVSSTTPKHRAVFAILVPGAADEEYQAKRCIIAKREVTFVADNPSGDHFWKEPRRLDDGIKIVGRVRWISRWLD